MHEIRKSCFSDRLELSENVIRNIISENKKRISDLTDQKKSRFLILFFNSIIKWPNKHNISILKRGALVLSVHLSFLVIETTLKACRQSACMYVPFYD